MTQPNARQGGAFVRSVATAGRPASRNLAWSFTSKKAVAPLSGAEESDRFGRPPARRRDPYPESFMNQPDVERSFIVALASATAQRCLSFTLERECQRETFGRPSVTRHARHRIVPLATAAGLAPIYTQPTDLLSGDTNVRSSGRDEVAAACYLRPLPPGNRTVVWPARARPRSAGTTSRLPEAQRFARARLNW